MAFYRLTSIICALSITRAHRTTILTPFPRGLWISAWTSLCMSPQRREINITLPPLTHYLYIYFFALDNVVYSNNVASLSSRSQFSFQLSQSHALDSSDRSCDLFVHLNGNTPCCRALRITLTSPPAAPAFLRRIFLSACLLPLSMGTPAILTASWRATSPIKPPPLLPTIALWHASTLFGIVIRFNKV